MNRINEIITTEMFIQNNEMNFYGCIRRDGFVFTNIMEPNNIWDAIIIRSPESCDTWRPKKIFSEKSLEEHIKIINEYKLEKALIIAEDISFITKCPSLKYLQIYPANTAPIPFDYSPLYNMPEIKFLACFTEYGGIEVPYSTNIDYSKINGLEEIFMIGSGHLNYHLIPTLKKITVSKNKKIKNFEHISCNPNFSEIRIAFCPIKSFKGIEKFKNIKQIELDYLRGLEDISDLKEVGKSLEIFRVNKCAKIKDFTCLNYMENMKDLILCGNNTLQDLNFLNNMTKIRKFVFDMYVLNHDLTPCLQVPFAYLKKDKKEYNLKNKDLPKNE